MHLRSSALLAAFVLGLTASVTALPDPNPITGRDEKPGKQSSSKTLGSESRGLDTTGFDAKLAAREGDGTCSLEFDFLSLNCKSAVDDFMKFGGSDEKKDACWHETTGKGPYPLLFALGGLFVLSLIYSNGLFRQFNHSDRGSCLRFGSGTEW